MHAALAVGVFSFIHSQIGCKDPDGWSRLRISSTHSVHSFTGDFQTKTISSNAG